MSLQDEGYTRCENPRIGKVNRFLLHWNNGHKYGYPLCCILRFSIEDALRDGKSWPIGESLAEKRGAVVLGEVEEDRAFVPCNIFHHKTEDI